MHKSLMILIIVGSTLSGVCLGAGSFGDLVVPNKGQVKGGEGVLYYMDAPWGRLYVTEQGLLLNIIVPEKQAEGQGPEKRGLAQAERSGDVPVPAFPRGKFDHPGPRIVHQTGILLDLPNACWREVIPEEEQVTKLNFFYGNDPKAWVTDVPTYARLRIKGIFPGTDLVLEQKSPEFWRFEGHTVWRASDLETQIEQELIEMGSPQAVSLFSKSGEQMSKALNSMPSDWAMPGLRSAVEGRQTMKWGTYLGGLDTDYIRAIVVAGSGDVVVTGEAMSWDFPVPNGYDTTFNGVADIFVAEFSADGSQLHWATFIGGSQYDQAYALDFSPSGGIIVAGATLSPDIPVSPDAFDTSYAGDGGLEIGDIYVAMISAEGNAFLWGTYIGGNMEEIIFACATDSNGDIILAGLTFSRNIPVPGGFNTLGDDSGEIYLAKLAADGRTLQWGSFLGGESSDFVGDLVLDSDDNLIIAGGSSSPDIPVPGGYDTTQDSRDIYIAKISITQNAVLWGTFLGGSWDDSAGALALDPAGAVIVVGGTNSPDIPTPNGFDRRFGGGYDHDGYIGKLSPDGSALLWGTYLGGSNSDGCSKLTITSSGDIIVAGETYSEDMPVLNGYDMTYNNSGPRQHKDLYIAKVAASGNALLWATYLGGNKYNFEGALALDREGNVLVGGWTSSEDFPVIGGYDTTFNKPPYYYPPDGVLVSLSDPPAGVRTVHVAAAAHTEGAYGSSWRTDGMALNVGPDEACYDLYYHPADAAGALCETRCLASGSAWLYEDIVGTACGLPDNSAGSLSLDLGGDIVMTTRTYTERQDGGTYGQFIKAVGPGQALWPGETGHLIGLKQNADYRTNIGFSEIIGRETEVSITVFDPSGSELLTSSFLLLPYGWKQIGLSDLGIANLDLGRAEISVTTGGAVFSYASVVDNHTGDAIYTPAKRGPRFDTYLHHTPMIAVAAHGPGAYGTMWRSDCRLYNPEEESGTIKVAYQTAATTYETALPISSGELVEIIDIVASLFPEAGDGSGSLRMDSGSGDVLALSRTYTTAAEGTYGQFVPAHIGGQLLVKGNVGWLPQLRCNARFRTNIGFTEADGSQSRVSVGLYDLNGGLLGQQVYTVPPGQNLQINDIFTALGVACVHDGTYARIEAIEGGSLYPYASVVDNKSGDAIFITLMKEFSSGG